MKNKKVMQAIHQDKPRYFEIQYLNSRDSILPFIKNYFEPQIGKRVLEIGSAEGGVLKAFVEKGCECVGVELSENRVKLAKEFQKEDVEKGNISFIAKNIFDIDENNLGGKFDLVILKDVIEHIHDQKKFMKEVSKFLNPNGMIFFGFPAWRMPFGGHQQIAKSKIASLLPFYHILPMPIYRGMLKLFGENENTVKDLVEIKDTRISTARFERLCKENNFSISLKKKYFVAPIYEYKFGFKTRNLSPLIANIPWFNDFFTTQSYYVISAK